MRQLIKEYFSFTKKERIAVISLLAVILAAYCAPYFIKPDSKKPSAKELAELKQFEEQFVKEEKKFADKNAKEHPPPENDVGEHTSASSLFYFDPNNISEEGWKQLGLRAKTIGTILKYLSKGGRFDEPPDLKKIYGLHANEYERLEPYIRIKPREGHRESYHNVAKSVTYTEKHLFDDPDKSTNKSAHAYARKSPASININDADTTAFISLPGIGNKLAARIIAFREKLGGFYSINQIAETYGLPDSTYQKILPYLTIQNLQPRKININTATLETLKQHPYIRWTIATAIIRYREQHGPFSTLATLQQIAAITAEAYNKLLPYVSLSE